MTPPFEASPSPEPQSYGRYTVIRLLGEGGMGRVFLAQDPVLQREVALKVITIDRGIDASTRKEYLARFSQESKALARLNHPSIVAVYDAGEENEVPWIAFEFVKGETLEHLIKRHTRVSAKQAVNITLDIASALEQAHGKRIVHRDIKPANILLDTATGIAKLTDFGVAKAPWSGMTGAGVALGSPGYMAPEQIDGIEFDERADLFALGVVIYEMLTGCHPFMRDTVAATAMATVHGAYGPIRELVTTTPPPLERLVARCLAPDPKRRIGSATEVIRELESFMQEDDSGGAGALGAGLKAVSQGVTKTIGHVGVKGAGFIAEQARQMRGPLAEAGRQGVGVTLKYAGIGAAVMGAWMARMGRLAWDGFRASSRRTQLIVAGVALIASLWIVTAAGLGVYSRLARGPVSLELALKAAAGPEVYASRWSPSRLASACAVLVNERRTSEAHELAAALANRKRTALQGSILLGRIALSSDDYEEAAVSLQAAASLPGGTAALTRERGAVLDQYKPKLARNKAPQAFVDILAKFYHADEDPLVRAWIRDETYWLRWNAVHILQAGDKRVDLVPVYILDLTCAGSMRTRMDAATQLGELGDRRAIPPLQKIAAKGLSDPLVAMTAQSVLDEKFK